MNRKQRRIAESQDKNKAASNRVPTVPADLLAKAITLHQAGNLNEAETLYKALLTANPNNADALNLLGTLQLQRGNLEECIRLLEKAIAVNPRHAEAYNSQGVALNELKQYSEALASYNNALALNPEYTVVYSNRATVLMHLQQYSEALESYNKAIALNPDHTDAYNNRGNALKQLKRYDEALASYDKAIALKPNYAEAYNNRGLTLYNLKKHNEALANYDKAIALNPNLAEAYRNRGVILYELTQYDDALASYNKTITINPKYVEAYYGSGLVKLTLGQYEEGWKLYEWRWKRTGEVVVRTFSKPLWIGEESLVGKTILLYAEQGLGDTIQFCRYAPMVEALGAKVILEVQPSLVSVVSTINPTLSVVAAGEPLPEFDFHCPLMSLPLAFGTTVNTIPANIPYLYTDPEKQKTWQDRLGNKTRLRIGLVWSGGTIHKNDHNRSMALNLLTPLLACDLDFYPLQKEIRPKDEAILANSSIISHADNLKDFGDTAALITEMDLIISVDTSVAHLAGALGKPVWILLPFAPDFRWMLEREDSPWYLTARLFRQPGIGDWEGIIEKVVAELKAFDKIYCV